MDSHGLSLATEKTEILFAGRKMIPIIIEMKIDTETIQTKRVLKQLGVMLDTKLIFCEHIRKTSDEAATVTTALSSLMADVKIPKPCKRQLLMTVAPKILLYDSEIWTEALKMKKFRQRMASVQLSGALRVVCSYHTVSESAALVIAGIMLIDLPALEKDVYIRQFQIKKRNS
ncbi:uncharacterized protein LOC117169984 [Belonocnema kinseyi]|uniref:uncharacterized protein LOC117169984 n=1 Tax=Belonocnema kinseyi TaxID=2817044 RepID=UPI00143E01CA|nr:uncharacterized protein LOC117169984 [Belonocnema kinseyi]